MASPALKQKEKDSVVSDFSQAPLAPDVLFPKTSRAALDDHISTSKNPVYASLLLGVQGICEDFASLQPDAAASKKVI